MFCFGSYRACLAASEMWWAGVHWPHMLLLLISLLSVLRTLAEHICEHLMELGFSLRHCSHWLYYVWTHLFLLFLKTTCHCNLGLFKTPHPLPPLSISFPPPPSWLSVVPSVELGLHFDSYEFCAAIWWWLGLGLPCPLCPRPPLSFNHRAQTTFSDLVTQLATGSPHSKSRLVFNIYSRLSLT